MNDCIFCKIAKKEAGAKIEYEDEDMVVFPDINPIKPVHLLVVPREHMPDFSRLNKELGGKIIEVIQKLVKEKELSDKGYRLVVNGGGAQHIDHLHFHITGPWGQKAGW